jgi:hypothetical protein
MKAVIVLAIVFFLVAPPASAQKKRVPKRRPRTVTKAPPTTANQGSPRVIGSKVEIVTKNGDHIVGEVLELTSYSIRIRADNLESTIALDTVASLNFGDAPSAPSKPAIVAPSSEFAKKASIVAGSFQSVVTNLASGIDYTEFRRQLNELHRAHDKLVSKYAGTENPTELHVIALLTATLTDYDWSRTIWTLKLGRSNEGLATESESPALIDSLASYPDIKAAAANGDKYEIEKVVGHLWRKAAEKVARARSLLGPGN